MKRITVIIALLATGLILALCGTALASDQKEVYVDSETVFEVIDAGIYQPRDFIILVIGYVHDSVDISYDHISKDILEKGVWYALGKTPSPRPNLHRYVRICLRYQGRDYKPFKKISDDWWRRPYCDVFGVTRELEKEKVFRDGDKISGIEWQSFWNPLSKEREQKEAEESRRAEMLERQKKEEEARKAKQMAEDKEKQEAKKRLDEFVNKNKITHLLSIKALGATPFVYEGKIVAVIPVWTGHEWNSPVFTQMLTSTQGIFAGSGFMEAIVVSDIPKGLFTSAGTVVIIAGRVLGKTEIKNPLGGTISVPHLKFVGVHFCKYISCGDILKLN